MIQAIVAKLQQGRIDEAIAEGKRFARRNPKDGRIYNLLGAAHAAQRRFPEAAKYFEKAAKLNPADKAAFNNLGNIRKETGDIEGAITSYKAALACDPNFPDALNGAGAALLERTPPDTEQARDYLQKALKLNPNFANAYSNLGLLNRIRGDYDAAIEFCRKALSLQPRLAEAHLTLGVALQATGKLEEALSHLRQAAALNPGDAKALVMLGRMLLESANVDAAIDCFRQALSIDPKSTEAHSNLGSALLRKGGIEEALTRLDEYAPQDPTDGLTHAWLATKARRPSAAYDYVRDHPLPPAPAAAATIWNVMAHCAAHDKLSEIGDLFALLDRTDPLSLADSLGLTSVRGVVCGEAGIARYLELQKKWSDALMNVAARSPLDARPAPRRGDRVKIGFFTLAGIGGLERSMLPLLQKLDPDRFETAWIMSSTSQAISRERWQAFQDAADQFECMIGANLRLLAERLAAKELDILIDLNGIQQPGSRVGALAWRPAHVQMTWAGSPTVCGLEALDYQILDRFLSPQAETLLNWEPLEMPESWISIGAFPELDFDDSPPSDKNGYVTFGTMLTPDKFHPDMLSAWAQMLERTPGSRLLFSRPEYRHEVTRENLRRWFARRGLGERVEFRWELPQGASHLDVYRDVDIALDAFPIGGGVTVAEALWMGVPATTVTGPLVQHLVGKSVLAGAGLEDLAADSFEGVVETTVALAEDVERRRELRRTLRNRLRRSSLIDTDRFAMQFGEVMWALAERRRLGPFAP